MNKRILLLLFFSLQALFGFCQSSDTQYVTFWTKMQGIGKIRVYINGNYVGTITHLYSSAPDCHASGCVTVQLKRGSTNYWSARSEDGGEWNNKSFSSNATCLTIELWLPSSISNNDNRSNNNIAYDMAGRAVATQITQNKRSDYLDYGGFFFAYNASPNQLFGLHTGWAKPRKIGGYVFGRYDIVHLLANDADVYSLDDNRNMSNLRFIETKHCNFIDAGIGLTKSIVFPLAMYVGGGVSYNYKFDVYENMDRVSVYSYEYNWVIDDSTKNWEPIFEVGLIMYGLGFQINVGYRNTKNFDRPLFTFGIGFSQTL